MEQPAEDIIDLTQADDPQDDAPGCCGTQHCTLLQAAMRAQLCANKQEIDKLLQERDDMRAEHARREAQLKAENQTAQALTQTLRNEIIALKDRLNKRGKRKQRTWPEMLKECIHSRNDADYEMIHKLCCKQENMSSSPVHTHPGIRLGVNPSGKCQEPDIMPQNAPGSFNFCDLPADIQARIFRIRLHKEEGPIHCFSRLDPFQAPKSWPVSKSKSGLLNRFYWGKRRSLNLTEDTADPQDVLRLLLVCKNFYFKGVHAFYSLNIFAFSSIGEFGRFCTGIGPERTARLQHIELTWTGNQSLTAERTVVLNEQGRPIETYDSLRTRPLNFFLELKRLRTLAIFINESDALYQRRQHEPPAVNEVLGARTIGQPNYRMNRCLRTVQGLDYIYALRGLDWVRMYDLRAMVNDINPVPALVPVRDTSFVADVNSTVTLPKSVKEASDCLLRSLPLLFPPKEGVAGPKKDEQYKNPLKPWDPTAADWSAAMSFYTVEPADNVYDPTRNYYGVHDLDLGENGHGDCGGPTNSDRNASNNNTNGSSVPSSNTNDGTGYTSSGPALDPRPQQNPSGLQPGAPRQNQGGGRANDDNEDRPEGSGSRNVQPAPSNLTYPLPPRAPRAPRAADPVAPDGGRRWIITPPPAARAPGRQPPAPTGLSPPAPPRAAPIGNPSGGSAGPSATAGQKRAGEDLDGTSAKRRNQGQAGASSPVQPKPQAAAAQPGGPAYDLEVQRKKAAAKARKILLSMASCRSIQGLLDPIALNLKDRDWDIIRIVLTNNVEARNDVRRFRAALEAVCQVPGNAAVLRRVSESLLN